MYLSSIQQGIQTAHVCSALTSEYRGSRCAASKLLREWEDRDRTIIVLNGGAAGDIEDGFNRMCNVGTALGKRSPYPFSIFYEEPGAIHGAADAPTAWGVVLPPEVYLAKPVEVFPSRVGYSTLNAEDITPGTPIWEPGSIEHFLCTYLQGKSLAR